MLRWRFFASFLRPVFPASRVQHISDLHSKFTLRPHGHTMCGSMVDIQCAAAEIRQGKKEEDRKKPQGKNIMSASATQGGHNYKYWDSCSLHSSAKARLTSAAIWRISMSSRFMSVNHFPHHQWRIRKTIPVSRRWSGSPPKFNNLFVGPLPTFPKNFMQIPSEVFAQSC